MLVPSKFHHPSSRAEVIEEKVDKDVEIINDFEQAKANEDWDTVHKLQSQYGRARYELIKLQWEYVRLRGWQKMQEMQERHDIPRDCRLGG
jgi:plasmid replication initiation protein